ncbi:MAG: glycosyltransferase family 4 protein [Lawsonibacter sp.]|jgi:glycogen(starch) synthase
MMKLIYYYPAGNNAPANLARELFSNIYARRDKLNFEIALFTSKDDIKTQKNRYPDADILSLREIKTSDKSTNSLIHIPTSPFVAPNERFLLHVLSLYRKDPLITNYHGDIRLETTNAYKNKSYKLALKYIPSYVLVPRLLQKSQRVIVNSKMMSDLIQKNYHVDSNIIPNALGEFWFQDPKKTLDLGAYPTIFYHGRLSYEKGVDILIRAFASCIKTLNSKAKLYIAGNGPLIKELMALSNRLGIEGNIDFLGYLDPETLKAFIYTADALIYPSRYEPFSLAILEAMSMARGPVYFSSRAGISNFVDYGRYDLLQFEPEIDSIYDVIKCILTEPRSNSVIAQQKEFAKKFSWNCVTPRYIELYEEFC